MASAIIPLISAALPLLLPFIEKGAIFLESKFGPKTGPAKFDTLLQATEKVAQALSTAGILPGALDQGSLAAMVQTVVSDLLGKGILTPEVAKGLVAQGQAPLSFQVKGGTLTLSF